MRRQAGVVLYVLALVAVVVGVDVLFFGHHLQEQPMTPNRPFSGALPPTGYGHLVMYFLDALTIPSSLDRGVVFLPGADVAGERDRATARLDVDSAVVFAGVMPELNAGARH